MSTTNLRAPTAGTWKPAVVILDGVRHYGVITDHRGYNNVMAVTGVVGAGDDLESIANAEFIAAAHDMAKALEALIEWGRDHAASPLEENSPHSLIIDGVAALQKARGMQL